MSFSQENMPKWLKDWQEEKSRPKRRNTVNEFVGYVRKWVIPTHESESTLSISQILRGIVEEETATGNDLNCLYGANNIFSAITCLGKALIECGIVQFKTIRPDPRDSDWVKHDRWYCCKIRRPLPPLTPEQASVFNNIFGSTPK